MHMLSIVQMLYLSSKSLFLHAERRRRGLWWWEDEPNGSEIIAY